MTATPADSATFYDITIVGAGMVGATLACALGDCGLKILLLDAQAPEPFSPDQPHDLRVSALSPASQTLLEKIGEWIRRKIICENDW